MFDQLSDNSQYLCTQINFRSDLNSVLRLIWVVDLLPEGESYNA